MTKLNDFILRNKTAGRSGTSVDISRYFVIWSLARASIRSSGGGGEEREPQENRIGGCVLGYKKVSNQSMHTY